MREGMLTDEMFLEDLPLSNLPRVAGTAVFMASGTDGIPNVMLHHVKHNKVLHKQVVLLSIVTENVPFVVSSGALSVRELGQGFFRVIARVGVHAAAERAAHPRRCSEAGPGHARQRYDVLPRPPDAAHHRQSQMAKLAQGAVRLPRAQLAPADAFFHLPPNRVVELGLQIEL